MAFDNILTVFDKQMNKIAVFTGDTDGISENAMHDLACSPTIKLQSGELALLTFQMLSDSPKFKSIHNPENLFHINDRWFTALTESSFVFEDNNGVSVCTITLPEIGSLLSRQYHQVYNCSIYCYSKAHFNRFVNDGAEFKIYSNECSTISNVITTANAWEQVKNWTTKDDDGNQKTYAVLTQDDYKPTKWEKSPSGVFFKSFSVSGNTATVIIESRAKINVNKTLTYSSSNQYNLGETPIPSSISGVVVNSTIQTGSADNKTITYTTSDKTVTNYNYNSNTGIVTVYYYPSANEKVNGVTISYKQNDLGEISTGATCTFAYGAEAVDEHTFVVLPKAKTKYKLTIDQVMYNDSEVKDSRGVVMPRGSGGYAMWAALKGTGWTLGICDVIALDFNASIDYGCFNVESDMKDTLSNIRMIQKLYGGILDWDSEHKILNYRAENYEHYQAYKDGFNEWKGYVFREGKNMTERPVITYDNTIITRAYLLGYGNLNVRKVNGGKTYIDNFDYTNDIYEGYLKQELIYDTRDEGGMKQLLYWGKKELEKQSRPRKNAKLTVTDVRTVEGLEHEVFDINDIVKVYYHDESTDTDVIEYQRVVMWEYNAFAMWDCTVELGDKTVNEVELFKLIYNKSINSPGVDGSGNISGGNINVGAGGDSGNSFWNQNSLTNHIELIARTTTDNSDAIAGLILDTSAVHAQVDLFAMYQKQTDNLLTQTYAGLQFYADEKKAEAIIGANSYTEEKVKDLDGKVTTKISQTEASLKTYADKIGSNLELVAAGYYEQSKKDNESLNNSIRTWAQAGFTAEQNARGALAMQFANFQQQENSNWVSAYANFATKASVDGAVAQMHAEYESTKNSIPSTATIQAIANEEIAKVSISAIKSGYAYLSVDGSGTISCSSSAYINLSSAGSVNLQANYVTIGQDHDTAVYIRGVPVLKQWVDIPTMAKAASGSQAARLYYFGFVGSSSVY